MDKMQDEDIRRYVDKEWEVRSINPKATYFVGNEDFPCYAIRTVGCGCCSDELKTLDLDLVIEVAKVQVKLAQKTLDELIALKSRSD